MAKLVLPKSDTKVIAIAKFIGEAYAFRTALKLHHWEVTGSGSYATHIALDQGIDQVSGVIDELAETSVALYGTLNIKVDAVENPVNIIKYCEDFHNRIKGMYNVFNESFQKSILDSLDESVVQLLYRLKRLM